MLKAYGQADSVPVRLVKPDTIRQVVAKGKAYLDSPVIYPAKDSTVISLSEKKIRMYGQAKITYQKMEITADYIEMSIDRKEIYATGRKDSIGQLAGTPVIKEEKETFETKEFRFNFDTKKAFLVDVRMKQEPEGFIHSHYTKRDSTGTLNIRNGKYTTCDAPEPHFYFFITKGMMVPDKMIVTGPLYLVAEGVPLYPIGLPFGFLPKQQKRASGILMPKYGEERNRGFFLRDGGYYFAINDRMDLSLTGGIYSRGSWQLGAQSRYKKIYKYSGNLGFNIANNIMGEKDLPGYSKKKDFSVSWSHAQDPKANPYNDFNASVNFSSSSYDRNNTYTDNTNRLQNPLEHLTNQKSSSVSYRRKFRNPLFNFTAKVGHSQNSIDRSVVLNAPSGSFTVGRLYPFKWASSGGRQKWYEKIEMRYTSSFENKVKAREDSIFMPDIFSKIRNGFQHEIPLSASFKPMQNMTFTPSLNYQGMLYFSHIGKTWDPVLDSIIINRINQLQYVQALSPNFNLSYTPRLYGFYEFKWSRIKTIRHVMSPSISFGYRPDLGYDFGKFQRTLVTLDKNAQGQTITNLQSYSIFDEGIYRLPSVAGRYGNISFSLGNNLEMKVKNPSDTTGQLKKVKLLESLSISTSYDIFRDSLNLSPIQLQARTMIMGQFNLSFRSVFNAYAIDSTIKYGRTTYRTINSFEVTKTGKLMRLTDADFSLGFTLPLKSQQKGGSQAQPKSKPLDYESDGQVDFKSDWNLRLDYNFRYTKPYLVSTITQSLRLTGDLSLTKKWKISFSSGYDFEHKQFTYTSLGIHRDLHCWQMNIDVVPFGERKSYTFTISANGSLLKDIKYQKFKDWRDQY
ncbi:MAG: LPS-assembly protein LptD [Porphyromonadaceae bacterium]|nr:MAG: LPS-assembly protein LptD [Porphyromonadaceae bacterium]